MDDFTLSNLYESKNEWSARLVSILTPLVNQGFASIFEEAWKLCKENKEESKYLMTFQNLISRVPKWNEAILEKEYERILEKSNCSYLGDLLSCVHVIQLKILTCVRAGKDQKKINIDIPKFTTFLHHVYINSARKLYTNIYLYENNVSPLQKQKYNREVEIIIQEAIINTIRQNMPIEELLRAYIDEHIEEDIAEEVSEKTYNVEGIDDSETLSKSDETIELVTDTRLKPISTGRTSNEMSNETSNEKPIWKDIDTDKLLENSVVSNNIANEILPDDLTNDKKAITFNEITTDNNLGISNLNDSIRISDDDVKINIESLDDNLSTDNLSLDIEELY
jgi:hypothetical protein